MVSDTPSPGSEPRGPKPTATPDAMRRSRPGREAPLRELVCLSLEAVAIWQVD